MDAHGKLDGMAHECPCGSGRVSDWCLDERGAEIRACERCKPALLHRIFEEKHLDLFEDWIGKIFFDPPILGYEWQWEDLLKEKGCDRVVGLEEAKRRRKEGYFLIACPGGNSLVPGRSDAEDSSVHILISPAYAQSVLSAGKMV